jgi:hypothetical protein
MPYLNNRSQKASNIQTEQVVYESEEVQVIETKSTQVIYYFP